MCVVHGARKAILAPWITFGLVFGHYFTILIHIESAIWCTDRNCYHALVW